MLVIIVVVVGTQSLGLLCGHVCQISGVMLFQYTNSKLRPFYKLIIDLAERHSLYQTVLLETII